MAPATGSTPRPGANHVKRGLRGREGREMHAAGRTSSGGIPRLQLAASQPPAQGGRRWVHRRIMKTRAECSSPGALKQ